jgi:hypothetical protein
MESAMTREIILTQGKVALVDDDNCERLNKFKWFAQKVGRTFYAARHPYKKDDPSRKIVYMHRMVLAPSEGCEIDHIDGNGCNNQKSNLRSVSHRTNIQNRHHTKSSRFPGVHFVKSKNFSWQANIQVNGIIKYLGSFKTEEEAYKRYKDSEERILIGLPLTENPSHKTSKYIGVCWEKDRKKWCAQIRINGKQNKIGVFDSEEDAHDAYQRCLMNVITEKL